MTVTTPTWSRLRVTWHPKLVVSILPLATLSHANNPLCQQLRPRPTNKRHWSSKRRMGGKRRSRLSFADSGLMARSVKTVRKSRAAALLTDRKNFRRRKVSADNTWHRFARTSWSTHQSALMARDAFSSIRLLTSASARSTLTWSRTTQDTPPWDFSKTLKAAR